MSIKTTGRHTDRTPMVSVKKAPEEIVIYTKLQPVPQLVCVLRTEQNDVNDKHCIIEVRGSNHNADAERSHSDFSRLTSFPPQFP